MLKIKKGYKIVNFESEIKKIGKKIYYWQKNKKNRKIINVKKFKLQADFKADILIKKCIKKFFVKPLILSEENKFVSHKEKEKFNKLLPLKECKLEKSSSTDSKFKYISLMLFLEYVFIIFSIFSSLILFISLFELNKFKILEMFLDLIDLFLFK